MLKGGAEFAKDNTKNSRIIGADSLFDFFKMKPNAAKYQYSHLIFIILFMLIWKPTVA